MFMSRRYGVMQGRMREAPCLRVEIAPHCGNSHMYKGDIAAATSGMTRMLCMAVLHSHASTP